MIIISFLADLLEMLQIGIGVESGHLLHGGHFGLNYPNNNREQRKVSESDPEYARTWKQEPVVGAKIQLPASGSRRLRQ